jgi:hypothetical protein
MKIYDAYKLKQNLNEIFDILHNIKNDIYELLINEINKNSAIIASEIIDGNQFNNPYFIDSTFKFDDNNIFKKEKNIEMKLINMLMKIKIGYSKASHNSLTKFWNGIDSKVGCIIIKTPQNESIIKLFCENEEVSKFFKKEMIKLKAEEYYYYDNTDQPEEIEEEEWKRRRKFWNKMAKYGSYKEMGFAFELGLNENEFSFPSNTDYEIFEKEILKQSLNIKEERIKNIAEDKFFQNFKDKNYIKKSEEQEYDISNLFYEYKQYIRKNENGKKEFEEFSNNIRNEIKELTKDMLNESYIIDDNWKIIKFN